MYRYFVQPRTFNIYKYTFENEYIILSELKYKLTMIVYYLCLVILTYRLLESNQQLKGSYLVRQFFRSCY